MLGWFLAHSLEPNRKQRLSDMFKQEEDQFKELGIKLKSSADPKKAEIRKVNTSFGETELIRWTNKSKKIVIFIHGIQTDKFTSSKAVSLWSKQGYDVISYDGYGWGTWRDKTKTRYGSNTEAKLLKEIIAYVKDNFEHTEIILHGESMGAGTVYRYLQKYGTAGINRVLVDAGYQSFEKNIRPLAFEKVPKALYYVGRSTFWFWMLLKRFPVRRQISAKTLKELNIPLLHIHSKTDHLVHYSYIQKEHSKFVNNAHYLEYKNEVRHVRGYYDSPKELEFFVKSLLKYRVQK